MIDSNISLSLLSLSQPSYKVSTFSCKQNILLSADLKWL